jgi:excisionase family DNA binding protein
MNDTNPPADAPPKWFSIAEAAQYLDIGEPTLYRWMRDGKITYRKVGDSTRFWKQDLDSVMEVRHSDKDLEQVGAVCPACHSPELVEGTVQSSGLNYFKPRKTKFWTFKTSNVDTEAWMCARCGCVTWFGDVEKLASLKQSPSSGPEPGAESSSRPARKK